MKKLLAILTSVSLLTGCAPLLPSPHGNVPLSDTIILSTQFPVYDDDIDRIQVIIENHGEDNVNYGVEWAMEVLQGDTWKQIPFAENTVWIQPLISLMPGGAYSFFVTMEMLDFDLKDGTYRVVKEISGDIYTAEFSIGESDVSAESPFGYEPLDELDTDYSTTDAAEDGVVVLHPDGTVVNAERLEAFLNDYTRGMAAQIRFATYALGDEDELFLEDVLVEKSFGMQQIRYTHDSSRLAVYNPLTYTRYFRYLTADDAGKIWLSNAPAKDDSEYTELLDGTIGVFDSNGYWAETLRAYAASNPGTTGAWSPDGMRFVEASRDDVLHFYVNIRHENGGELGYTADLLSVKPAERITEVVWQDNTVVMLVCSNQIEGVQYYGVSDTYTYCFYDTEAAELLRTVVSSEKYRFDENMNIVIPE
ncbi:MAG: hypothetical protein IKY52_07320 [Clostridia bacterium]|nr:hypothetical protein [Clostridia bacterium]